jgi:hypothetical protein
LAAGVEGTVFDKGLANNRVGIKASSNSLIWPFTMAFFDSIPPMESSIEYVVAQSNQDIWDNFMFLRLISEQDFPFLFVTSLFSIIKFLDWLPKKAI